MGKGKGTLVVRKRAALVRLEAAYELFRAAGGGKLPWSSTRNGQTIYHSGRSYKDECSRMKTEIENLKKNIAKIS